MTEETKVPVVKSEPIGTLAINTGEKAVTFLGTLCVVVLKTIGEGCRIGTIGLENLVKPKVTPVETTNKK